MNELTKIVEESGLQQNKIDSIMKNFSTSFQQAREAVENSKGIVVKDESDVEGMKSARENRLKLQKIRTGVEKTRIALKEQSKREGKAIDGAANIIKALVKPVEEYLMTQEKFAEVKEKERAEIRYSKRLEELSKYVPDVTLYKLREMSDESFEYLLSSSKKAHKDKLIAEKKAEDDRIEFEKKVKLYGERRFILNKYSDFIELTMLTVDTNETEYESLVCMAKESKDTHDKNQEKIRLENEKLKKAQEVEKLAKQKEDDARAKKEAKIKAENDAKLEAAKKKTEEAEEELREEKESQRKALEWDRKRIADGKKLEEEEKRKALLAPDKEKLLTLHDDILNINMLAVKSKKANDLMVEAQRKITTVTDWLYEEVKAL